MLAELQTVVLQLLDHRDVSAADMERAAEAVMDGRCQDAELGSLLTALRCRGETVDELVGAARVLRRRAARTPTHRTGLLDTCGTGGDGCHTFNISTAAALVAAAAGVPVAKHGNRSASSVSGSADVLEALGVAVTLTPTQVGQCIDELGLGFCFAPVAHSSMKHAAAVRKQLGFRTLFNLLGPLTNPAGAEHQLIGASRIDQAALLAQALAQLGTTRSLVVCGNNELDEVSLWGQTTVFEVAGTEIRQKSWTATDLGLPECQLDSLRVHSAAESANVIRSVLSGQRCSARDIVLANAAAAIWVTGAVSTPAEGAGHAAEAIDSGAAARRLEAFASLTQRLAAAGAPQ
jgi:anthranilate phosphoribosyltransferase